MVIKANLHFHSQDDPQDFVDYSFEQGVREAAKLGFQALALTCHHWLIDVPDYPVYAQAHGVLLIPGVERSIERRHVVILNPKKDIETVSTFQALKDYKKKHPEIFILAPHPYFGSHYCLGPKLEEHLELFDAIECSWFYSKKINRNLKAEALAKKHGLPYLATSDTHELGPLNRSYALIEAEEKSAAAIFQAIRNKKFENHSEPSRFWPEMIWPVLSGKVKTFIRKKLLGNRPGRF